MLSLLSSHTGFKLALVITAATLVAIGTPAAVAQPSVASTQSQLVLDSLTDWRTASRLDRFTSASISASWTEADLRGRLTNFAHTQKAAIFVDRRIDPSQLVNITMNQVSPEQFLWAVAAKQEIGVSRVGDFYYFGPPETAASLPTLWEKIRSESSKRKRNYKVDWTKRQALKTTQIVHVKKLIEEIAEANKFKIANPEAIPHDVWSEFELPKMSLDGRMAILLVGFDKWFKRSSDGRSIEIIDFEPVKRAEYETAEIDDPRATAKELKPKFPTLKITGTNTRLSASGPPMDVAKLRAELIGGQVVKKVKLEDIVYKDLTARASRLGFLQTVANQVSRKLSFDPEIRSKLDEQIDLELLNVTVFELLDATLKGSGLKYEITETEIKVSIR